MSNPLGTEFLSVPLRNFSVAQMQDSSNFIARSTLTKIPVAQQSAEYYVIPQDDWLRSEVKPLGRGSESAGGGWHLSDDNYNAKVYAIHKDNDMQDYANANAAQIMNLDQDATAYVTEQMQIFEDTMFRETFMPDAGGVWTTELQGTSAVPTTGQFLQWDDPDSTPVDDIRTQVLLLASQNGGRKPTDFIISPHLMHTLTRNPQVADLYQFTQGGVVSEQALAAAIGVPNIKVAWAVANSAKEGLSSDIDFLFGDNALLGYFAASGGPKTNTAGAMFTWTEMDGGSSIGTRVDRIPAPLIHSVRIEAMAAFDMKVVNPKAAVLFLDCTSS